MQNLWRPRVKSLIEEIRRDVRGAELLADWLGSGGQPVTPLRAEHRAAACISGDGGYPCPLNKEPNWWDRIKSRIAEWIRGELELKAKMGLRVQSEDHLGMCAACGWCLPLKVWVPIDHLKAHTGPEVLNKTPLYCWMRRELHQP